MSLITDLYLAKRENYIRGLPPVTHFIIAPAAVEEAITEIIEEFERLSGDTCTRDEVMSSLRTGKLKIMGMTIGVLD